MGLLLTMVGRVSATTGSVMQDAIVMILYCAPLVIAYRYFGLMATLTGWWFGFMAVRLGVYIGSPDLFILSNGIQLAFATAIPFIAGFLLHRYGSDHIGKRFVPEYEERNNKQLRIEKEFQIAKDSQFALMPKLAPVCYASEVKGFFIPSFEVGGDFFDYQTVGDELMITVVDVSGKAMKAAFSAIFTSGLLLSRVASKHPAQVLTDINPMLHERTDKQTFITCLLARYDFKSRVFRFANAGHCRPLLKRDGKVQYMNAPLPRFPLGFRADVTYAETDFQLQPGDVVMLYSDGLPEARNPKGVLFDYSGMEKLIGDIDTEALSAEQICDVIRQEILTFSNYDLADDMTVVVLKVVYPALSP
jgi:serine phosphatase RsbU (regulator of sigma subunit)